MHVRLNITNIKTLRPANKEYFVWDDELPCFGVKIFPSGVITFVVQYRKGAGRGQTIRKSIGRLGTVTPDQARSKAKDILAAARLGSDPLEEEREARRKHVTVAALCDLYLHEGCATKKASTLATDTGRIRVHIKPLIGNRRVSELKKADIQRFLADVADGHTRRTEKTKKHGLARVRGGKGTATRTVGLLGAILQFAVEREMIESNPARGVKRFPDQKCERFLSIKEIARLHEALGKAEQHGTNPFATAAIRILLFTGARKSEIVELRWKDVDLANNIIALKTSKTGARTIQLNHYAHTVLETLPRVERSDWVFPSDRYDGSYTALQKDWAAIRKDAELEDVRLHDLRHTFASIAAANGASLPEIGKLLGHKDPKTTQRYVHLTEAQVRRVNDIVGESISSAHKRVQERGLLPMEDPHLHPDLDSAAVH